MRRRRICGIYDDYVRNQIPSSTRKGVTDIVNKVCIVWGSLFIVKYFYF